MGFSKALLGDTQTSGSATAALGPWASSPARFSKLTGSTCREGVGVTEAALQSMRYLKRNRWTRLLVRGEV